ncbi:hypothetical protein AOL_s00075g53 [Orbilia oligospora ATCC 24927]|uniref:Heterokaryon incompatibility domain-containing protein n=1 Tax=Arthrobotrys oligospora (strain ATCC 24927 / CBS 115.81 / DSM 1491) TaxID=756982 RepID=G1X854_ARTOA|nr:hypothetical protein AOL_s00075g53 [Orbilia oligospora ATCC 24927]EGX50627.1 hypothetical protein AOL_s00075g53 [Orbilia oligospora ATCC 24927]
MHDNYKKAKHTVVFDLELADFKWTGDGHSCLALALSTWFSRGWTALELRSSESVKVVFKNPNGGRRVLKDLDSKIVQPSMHLYAHPGWKSVAEHIRWLRRNQSNFNRPSEYPDFGVFPGSIAFTVTPIESQRSDFTIDSLLSILEPRYTCWARDRIIIAALLVGTNSKTPDQTWFDPEQPRADISRKILIKIGSISYHSIFHDEVPIFESGPWSWCPPSLFGFGSRAYSPGSVYSVGAFLSVGTDGHLYGNWNVFELPDDAADRLRPHASHPHLKSRIMVALREHTNFYLLSARESRQISKYLLAKATEQYTNDQKSKCWQGAGGYFPPPAKVFQYVGIVIGQLPPDAECIAHGQNCRL